MNILIVDDDPVSREKLGVVLSEFGRCVQAPDGETALDFFVNAHAAGVPFDLVTLDIEMPILDGLAVLSQIRQWEKENGPAAGRSKIVMVTVQRDKEYVLGSVRVGCDGYMLKPFTGEQVRSTLSGFWDLGSIRQGRNQPAPGKGAEAADGRPAGHLERPPRRILVVDDDDVSLQKLTLLMERYGTCTAASSGAGALRAYSEALGKGAPFEVLSMDIELPDVSGIEVLKEIRRLEESRLSPGVEEPVKVVMVTGIGDQASILECIRMGCTAYILKPFNRRKVEESVSKLLGLRRVLVLASNLEAVAAISQALEDIAVIEKADDLESAKGMVRQAYVDNLPYDLAFLDPGPPVGGGAPALEALSEIYSIAEARGGNALKIVVLTTANDRQSVLPCLKKGCAGYLVEPLDPAGVEGALENVGISWEWRSKRPRKQPGPPSPPVRPPEDGATPGIHGILSQSGNYTDIEFRIRLEKVLNTSGEEDVRYFVSSLFSDIYNLKTRMNMVRVMGYYRRPEFLDALDRIIRDGGSFFLVKEAVIAMSKYGDRKAFNILCQTLKKIQDPQLVEQISSAIARIRQDDPILALVPRFLAEAEKASFGAVVDTFKRILTPPDARIFLDYLNHGSPAIVEGAFEILTHTADPALYPTLRSFFGEEIARFRSSGGADGERMAKRTLQFKQFYSRFPQLAQGRLHEMEELLDTAADARLKNVVVSVLAMSHEASVLKRLRSLYAESPGLRELLLQELSNNEMGIPFVLEKFGAEKILRDKIARYLADSKCGRRVLIESFSELSEEGQEAALRHINIAEHPDSAGIMARILRSPAHAPRVAVLSKLQAVPDGGIRDLLLDPALEEEFYEIGDPYFTAVSTSCPFRFAERFIRKTAAGEQDPLRMHVPLGFLQKALQWDMLFSFPDEDTFSKVAERVLKASDKHLNMSFLSVLQRVNPLDNATMNGLQKGVQTFVQLRGEAISDEESNEVRQVRESVRRGQKEEEVTAQFFRDLMAQLVKTALDPDALDQFFIPRRQTASWRLNRLADLLRETVKTAAEEKAARIEKFVRRYPVLAEMVLAPPETRRPPLPSVSLRFRDAAITAAIRDQWEGVFPEFKILVNPESTDPAGLLVCDVPGLSALMYRNEAIARKIILYLENREDFQTFQSLNPKVFMPPVSLTKLLRLAAPDAFLL